MVITFLSLWLTAGLIAQDALMALPAGDSAWVVRVTTKGGILGTGIGDFALSSEGKLVCAATGLQCPKEFQPSAFQFLVETVKAGTLQLSRVRVSYCNDCITRTITISRRDSMGIVHTYTATWDDTTKSRLPQDVSRIYDAALALISAQQ